MREHMGFGGGGHNHDHHHHHHHHHDDKGDGGGRGEGAPPGARESEVISRVGLWSDAVLTVAKGLAGWLSGSTAILADAAHSVSDIALSGVTLWSVRAANTPKDKEHPYGHGKFETVGALGVSAVLVGTGAAIGWHALVVLQDFLPALVSSGTDVLNALMHQSADAASSAPPSAPASAATADPGTGFGQASQAHIHHLDSGHHHHHHHHLDLDPDRMGVALAVAVTSVGVKEGLYWATKAVGDKYDNHLIRANAWHHRSDSVSSVAAAVGIGGVMVGMPVLDPLAALLVSGLIVRAGAGIALQSVHDLVDSGLPESTLAPMLQVVCAVPQVEGCHNLRGRRMGSRLHIDVHIEVDPELTVRRAHDIGDSVKVHLRNAFPAIAEVFVHIDPSPQESLKDQSQAQHP